MTRLSHLNVVWLTGPSCDGCTIKVLGDCAVVGIEQLLAGTVPGLPRIDLIHPALAVEHGEAFVANLRRAARGELEPFALVVEASIPDEEGAGAGFYAGCGEDESGKPIGMGRWLDMLAPRAAVVIAWGDCAAWGGPHSLAPNPIGATGASEYLGLDYRSSLDLPVINMPGCCPPPIFIETLAALIRWIQGEGPPIELDELDRPAFGYGATFGGEDENVDGLHGPGESKTIQA